MAWTMGVFEDGLDREQFIFLMFPTAFFVIVMTISYLGSKSSKHKRIKEQADLQKKTLEQLHGGYKAPDHDTTPLEFKSQPSCCGILFFGVFTVGFGIPLVMSILDPSKIDEDVPHFIVWGVLGLIVGGTGLAVLYQVLALFNPRLQATLDPGVIRLGESGDFTWQFTGRPSRIGSLSITLEAREKAVYRVGTDTKTVYSVFHKEELFSTTHPPEIRMGKLKISVPEFSMHSFESSNNAVEWRIVFHGDIPQWPDVKEEIIFPVSPLPIQEGNYHA